MKSKKAEALIEKHCTKLIDLVKSDFAMPQTDPDWKLSHEQMIKVCKLLLHMVNNTNIRIIEQKADPKREIDDIFEMKDGSVRSQLEEISTVMHNVH